MRTDSSLSQKDFRRSPQWSIDPFTNKPHAQIDQRYEKGAEQTDSGTQWHSFSGHERNCFFVNHEGREFSDQSSLSGLDQIADSRSFVIWDFDHDGASDLGLVNANYPLLNLYHNQIARSDRGPSRGSFVALQFTGGNHSAYAHPELSARDAYGAVVQIKTATQQLLREHRCGEGFAAQNSATLLVGLGEAHQIDELTVRWPSGKIERWENLPVGSLLQIYETPEVSPERKTMVIAPYQAAELPWKTRDAHRPSSLTRHAFPKLDIASLMSPGEQADRPLYLLTTMATWCEACHRHHPHLERLAAHFGDQLALLGIPVDPIETPEELTAHAQKFKLPYRVLTEIAPERRDTIVNMIRREYDTESIPSSVLVNREGQVLQIFLGTPTTSEVGRWLE